MPPSSKVDTTEKTPEIELIIKQLREVSSLYNEALTRLNAIGNRLNDDAGAIESDKEQTSPKNPGRISDLNEIVVGYRALVNGFDRTITKIEKFI